MARVERRGQHARIVAESREERALLADALARGGELPLREALYPISAEALHAPATLDEGNLDLLRRAFEAASRSHARALGRRASFRVI